jgi:uncharacterized protein
MRQKEIIRFSSGQLHLEGVLTRRQGTRAAIISHPHPLYGGDMDNYVVSLLAGAFDRRGWSTLIFNFRGVGRSEGGFDQGRGEQEDVLSALAFLKNLGMQDIVLAGYSFGAWVNAQAAGRDPAIAASILVSPPLAMLDFSFLKADAKTRLITCGDRDDFCPVDDLNKLIQEWPNPPHLKIIHGADHFFSSGAEKLVRIITEAASAL